MSHMSIGDHWSTLDSGLSLVTLDSQTGLQWTEDSPVPGVTGRRGIVDKDDALLMNA